MQVYKYAEKHGLETKELLKRLKSKGFKVTPLSKMTAEMQKALAGDVSRETPKAMPEIKAPLDGTKHYQSKSARLHIGGFKPESRRDGYFKPDEGIQFENHAFITNDKEKQLFVEGCQVFKDGYVSLISIDQYAQLMQDLANNRTRMREEAASMGGVSR